MDEAGWLQGTVSGDAVRELERRLLVHGDEVHTATGAHEKILKTWNVWVRDRDYACRKIPPERAKRELEAALAALNAAYGGRGRLPWVG